MHCNLIEFIFSSNKFLSASLGFFMGKRVSFIIKDVVNSSLIYIFITFFSWTCKINFNIDIQYLCIILKNKSADWLSDPKQVLRNPSHYWPRLALLFPEIRCQYRQSKASSSCFLLMFPQHPFVIFTSLNFQHVFIPRTSITRIPQNLIPTACMTTTQWNTVHEDACHPLSRN